MIKGWAEGPMIKGWAEGPMIKGLAEGPMIKGWAEGPMIKALASKLVATVWSYLRIQFFQAFFFEVGFWPQI